MLVVGALIKMKKKRSSLKDSLCMSVHDFSLVPVVKVAFNG